MIHVSVPQFEFMFQREKIDWVSCIGCKQTSHDQCALFGNFSSAPQLSIKFQKFEYFQIEKLSLFTNYWNWVIAISFDLLLVYSLTKWYQNCKDVIIWSHKNCPFIVIWGSDQSSSVTARESETPCSASFYTCRPAFKPYWFVCVYLYLLSEQLATVMFTSAMLHQSDW